MNRTTNAILTISALAGSVIAQTVTVDTAADTVDFGGARMVADLPGPDGRVSFREALMATNNTTGPQTVAFAVPQNEWWYSNVKAMLENDGGTFVVSDDETTIDFMTQTAFTGDTNPNGRECGVKGTFPNGMGSPAIVIYGNHCVVRGMAEVEWRRESVVLAGDFNRVVECVTGIVAIDPYPNHCAFNTIGGTAPEDRNELFQIQLVCGADDNIVIGNTVEQIFVGASPYCDTSSRNRIGGPTPEERNVINGFGYYGEEGFPVGEGIEVSWATDTLIEGNYIGVNADGTARVPQTGPTGIEVNDSDNTTIRGNLIAGLWVQGANHYAGQLFGQAISVNAINRDNNGVVIEDNLIGTDHTGQNLIKTLNGVIVSSYTSRYEPRDVVIGGTEAGQGNLIAFCERLGVGIAALIDNAAVSGNSIHDNLGLGIDLATFVGFDGVTPNDPGDTDTNGANALQNYPVLATAETTGSTIHITGNLNSRPNTTYRVEFFANAACDPTGYGEGEIFLGSVEVTTNGSGNATIDAGLGAAVPAGAFITATATHLAAGATSEFAACIEAAQGGCPADFNADGAVNTLDVLAFLNAWSAGEPSADFNADGTVNTLDVLAFLNAWSAGC
jgi:hypothetical protein